LTTASADEAAGGRIKKRELYGHGGVVGVAGIVDADVFDAVEGEQTLEIVLHQRIQHAKHG